MPHFSSHINTKNVVIDRLGYFGVWSFSRLRREIEKEARHLAVASGERKESPLRALARMILSRGRMVTLVAKKDKEMIGYASLIFPRFSKLKGNAYLTISIRQAYRGVGIGSELMYEAELAAKKEGARRIELEVFAKNEKALRLYERLGYEREGVKKRAVTLPDGFDDIIFMAKFIN